MTDLSTANLERLLAEERKNQLALQWTYKGAAASSIYHEYPSKHEEIYGLRVEREISQLVALGPELAQEVLRMREELANWANDEARAHNALVKRAQETGSAGIVSTHETIYNRIIEILGDHDG